MTEFKKNCFILVGELSGEEHAETFLPELLKNHQDYNFWGVGGEQMRSWGVEIKYSLRDFSSMGFTDVLKKIFFYKKVRTEIINEIIQRNTKLAILVDFQGFNMSLLKPLYDLNVKVLYFVAPQAWAWKSWRANLLKKYVEKLFCILPFEEEWFKSRGVSQAVSVAHPSFLRMHLSPKKNELVKQNTIVWLPGSRKGEIETHWPIFQKASKLITFKFPEYNHALIASPAFFEMNLDKGLESTWKVYTSDDLFKGLSDSTYAVAASGTVTLNCALMELPTVVCYRVSLLNGWIFRSFIKYKGNVSLANLLLGRKVFPELLQEECNEQVIFEYVSRWIKSAKLTQEVKTVLSKFKLDQLNLKSNCVQIMNSYFN